MANNYYYYEECRDLGFVSINQEHSIDIPAIIMHKKRLFLQFKIVKMHLSAYVVDNLSAGTLMVSLVLLCSSRICLYLSLLMPLSSLIGRDNVSSCRA